jgi:hypothetical protein
VVARFYSSCEASDADLIWPLLKPGGGLDDYGWPGFPAPERCPALVIDAFLSVIRGELTVVDRGYQVWVTKSDGARHND